jgi:formate C-acetyltransferase
MLINQAPKFGNDVDFVDELATEMWQFVSIENNKYIAPLGNRSTVQTAWPMTNMLAGSKVWATPDGRKAGEPFAQHMGPTDGRDVNGPVANINSITKLGLDKQMACVHNLYFVNVKSEEEIYRMVDLIDYFFIRGGSHVQFNCQDKQVFIDAQKHPEKYKGLMVRVAGYVAYFVDLPKETQDQIITRSTHNV